MHISWYAPIIKGVQKATDIQKLHRRIQRVWKKIINSGYCMVQNSKLYRAEIKNVLNTLQFSSVMP